MQCLSLADAGVSADPRLAAVLTDDGDIDRVTVQRLLDTAPSKLTIEQLDAMHVIVFEDQQLAAGLEYTQPWIDAFVQVTGGTTEKVTTTRDEDGGIVRTRTIRCYRGRADVRQYRARFAFVAPPRVRACTRTARPRERRAAASSRSAGCDPGDSSGPSDLPAPAPLALAPKTFGFTPEVER